MYRPRQGYRFAGHLVFAALCVGLTALPSAQAPLRPSPEALASASPQLIERLHADPFTYFRFVNRAWTARVCEALADVKETPIVRLHGDAHLEQFAFTKNAWGLSDFDDSARGPAFIDVVRFLGSIDLATRQRNWTRDREAMWDRFLRGYRQGLSNPDYRPREPDIVRRLRRQASMTPAAYLAWGESLMQPMDDAMSNSVVQGMADFDRFVRRDRPELVPGYFTVVRAGWLRLGIGSAATRKVLIRVEGPTIARDDDVLIEIKEVTNLGGLGCLEESASPQAARVINGARQIGRLKHDILAVGPTTLISAAADRAEPWMNWWVASWEPSYREVHVSDLRSVADLAAIAFDSGVQLGANKTVAVRERALSSIINNEPRLRRETSKIVDELMAGWQELAAQ
jgi:hypothetical protein